MSGLLSPSVVEPRLLGAEQQQQQQRCPVHPGDKGSGSLRDGAFLAPGCTSPATLSVGWRRNRATMLPKYMYRHASIIEKRHCSHERRQRRLGVGWRLVECLTAYTRPWLSSQAPCKPVPALGKWRPEDQKITRKTSATE